MNFESAWLEILKNFYISKRVWLEKGVMTAIVFIFVVLVAVALVLILLNVYKFPL